MFTVVFCFATQAEEKLGTAAGASGSRGSRRGSPQSRARPGPDSDLEARTPQVRQARVSRAWNMAPGVPVPTDLNVCKFLRAHDGHVFPVCS